MALSTIATSTILHLGVRFLLPLTPTVRNLTLISALATALVPPYTLTVLLPINNRLGQLHAKYNASTGPAANKLNNSEEDGIVLTTAQEKEVDELLASWDRWHFFRLPMMLVGSVSSLVALIGVFAGW